jgi:hypothetical protein
MEERLSDEFISKEDDHVYQSRPKTGHHSIHQRGQGKQPRLIDLSDLGTNRNDLDRIKNNYLERYSKHNPSENVF